VKWGKTEAKPKFEIDFRQVPRVLPYLRHMDTPLWHGRHRPVEEPQLASRYAHVVSGEDAMKVVLLPTAQKKA
jgi:hypothetical protein